MYRELAGYVVSCINHFSIEYGYSIDVIAYPVNAEAPFQFSFAENVKVESRDKYNSKLLVEKIKKDNYDLVLVGGWADKEYMKAIRSTRPSLCVLAFDSWWNGTLKQYLLSAYSRLFIKPYFQFAFVPGHQQSQLALHLGFRNSNIIQGMYSADVSKFAKEHNEPNRLASETPKRLMYVGRYSSEKFINELQQVFFELWKCGAINWKLVCAGTGILFEKRIQHEAIEHLGFLQPEQLVNEMRNANAFVLPSTFEPWGVVVHEFAAAGVPLILSENVGAKSAFLRNGENGFIFESGDSNDLSNKLKLLFAKSDNELAKMGELSYTLALKITPDTWAKSLHQLMQ